LNKSAKKKGKAKAKSPRRMPITCSNSKDSVCGFQGQVMSNFKEMGAEFDRIFGNKNFGGLENNQFYGLRDVIILDTGSSIPATFMNPDFVQDIRPAKKPLRMATNAGTKILTMKGDVPDFGEVWYDPSQMANIIGFQHLAEKHRVTYDTDNDDFIVDMGHKTIRFVGTPQRLYVWDKTAKLIKQVAKHKKMKPPSKSVEVTHVAVDKSDKEEDPVDKSKKEEDTMQAKDYDTEGTSDFAIQGMVSSVAENRMHFTKRKYDDAVKARKLYHIVGCPSVENFKAIIRQNILTNCPVTVADVDAAKKIFGPNIGTLKGKSTIPTSPVVKDDLVEIPMEIKELHKDIILCIDIMFVNGIPMLTCIDRSLRFCSLVPMENCTKAMIYKALDKVLRQQNRGSHTIKAMH